MVYSETFCHSKRSQEMLSCGGYRQNNCCGCPKADTVLIYRCDECGEELNEDNPMYEHEGRELCGVCYGKVKGVKADGNPGTDHR